MNKSQELIIVIEHYLKSKEIDTEKLKETPAKRKIILSRHFRAARDLIKIAGSREEACKAINKIASWAKSRKLDYTIETVLKRWLEIDLLKPREIIAKPFFEEMPMIWSSTKKKWYCVTKENEWLEFAGDEKDIKWIKTEQD